MSERDDKTIRRPSESVLISPNDRLVANGTVIGTLGLTSRVEVLESRGEQVADAGMTFDAAISRATLSPTAWLALGDRLAPAGEVVVLLARDPEPGLEHREVSWRAEYATRAGAPRVAIGLRRHV